MYGNTPLHVAAQYSSKLEIVEFLLDKDASRQLIRDFNELQISNVKSADFINITYSKSKQTIYDCLHDYLFPKMILSKK